MYAKIPLPTRTPSLPPPLIPICTAIFLSGYSQVTGTFSPHLSPGWWVWAQRWHIDYSHAGDTTDSSTDGSQLASRNTVSQCSAVARHPTHRASYLCRPANQWRPHHLRPPCPGSSRHQSNRLMFTPEHQKTKQTNINLPAVSIHIYPKAQKHLRWVPTGALTGWQGFIGSQDCLSVGMSVCLSVFELLRYSNLVFFL